MLEILSERTVDVTLRSLKNKFKIGARSTCNQPNQNILSLTDVACKQNWHFLQLPLNTKTRDQRTTSKYLEQGLSHAIRYGGISTGQKYIWRYWFIHMETSQNEFSQTIYRGNPQDACSKRLVHIYNRYSVPIKTTSELCFDTVFTIPQTCNSVT